MATSSFDEYSKQVKDWQKKVLKTTASSFSKVKNKDNSSAPWNKVADFQKSWLNAAIKAQETGVNTALSAQQDLWRNYFKVLRSNPYIKNKENS